MLAAALLRSFSPLTFCSAPCPPAAAVTVPLSSRVKFSALSDRRQPRPATLRRIGPPGRRPRLHPCPSTVTLTLSDPAGRRGRRAGQPGRPGRASPAPAPCPSGPDAPGPGTARASAAGGQPVRREAKGRLGSRTWRVLGGQGFRPGRTRKVLTVPRPDGTSTSTSP